MSLTWLSVASVMLTSASRMDIMVSLVTCRSFCSCGLAFSAKSPDVPGHETVGARPSRNSSVMLLASVAISSNCPLRASMRAGST